ncbi:DUF4297 family anti-phage-associated protein [Halobacillus amylolyticus]|uniref:Restriction endonuclease n=1 Tax=Halobacillus amylolyticus TaxID=2932259 RepID=A0ABY4H7X2_9BACI|nr:DUF4297 family anti-phage-associated protein [Halobacillus amylolyticus]UOR10636.1 hypothetical protein MUO15_13325 [Halobacillus amylolyticus]
MSTREATDTIRGYFYQFDYSIAQLLGLSNVDDSITIEGIEDVDIKTVEKDVAIQCKYYAKTEYNHSVIAKPIRLMLTHFKDVKSGKRPSLDYHLYGHYKSGQHKLTLPIDIDFLKDNFLTYTKDRIKSCHHEDLALSDDDLREFLNKLNIDIHAKEYNEQWEQVIDSIKEHFDCTKFEAEHFYYNNAIKLIKEISTKPSGRTVSKSEFLRRIDTKEILFNEWFVLFKGRKKFLRNLRNQYFPSTLNTSPYERFFLIEVNSSTYERLEIKELIFLISKRWSNLSRRNPTTFCPYIYIHNISAEELINLKIDLHSEGFNFIDGFDFHGAPFSPRSMCVTAGPANNINVKIINDIEHIKMTLDEISTTKEVYQFYQEEPYFNSGDISAKHIKIPLQDIKEIKEVI